MIVDIDARQHALDPEQSFIVQAPAGSGKTGLLVYRYLRLLSRVDKPQNILAITFTRKARAEMRERIIELLIAANNGVSSADHFEQQGILLATSVLERDKQLDWQILAAPQQLQILTIDAFSAKLAASMPWLSRLGDRPRTTDAAQSHYAFAVEQLFDELLLEDSAIASPLKMILMELDFNYDKARRLFSSMLAKRDQWLRHLVQNNLSEMKSHLERAWSVLLVETLSNLTTLFSDATLEPLLELAVNAANRIDFNDAKSVQSLAVLVNFNGNIHALLHQHWCALADFVLVQKKDSVRKSLNKHVGFPPGKYDDKTRCIELFDQLRDDQTVIEALAEVSQLPSPRFSDYDWERLVALEAVLKALAARLQLRFRTVNECDHSEVTQRANLALTELNNPTDLGLMMDGQLHHVLVDEFQDTSNSQLDLLKKLTSGWSPQDSPARTLFLVGDPMQSIYRFREADVGLFLQVANNQRTQVFENIHINSLTLSQNFRSSRKLVDWFNTTFAQSFPKHNDVLTGAITYAAAHSSKADTPETTVDCHLVTNNEQEGQCVLRSVQTALAELPDSQAQVAILVRTRAQLDHLLPVLDQHGIEYTALDIQPLHEQQAIQDVIALCKTICREDDKLSWLALLRGPWCGLTLAEIHLFNRQPTTLWQSIKQTETQQALCLESQTRLRRFVDVMRTALEQHLEVDLGSLTRWTWQRLGGAQTLGSTQADDVEQVFDLLNRLQRGGDLPTEKELTIGLERLRASQQTGDTPRVVVSTIHKAKGLQYHTVILPSLSGKSRADDREILLWAEHQARDGDTNLLLAPLLFDPNTSAIAGTSHYEFLRQLDSKRSLNEVARLMYVACTRAEKKLILIGLANQRKKDGYPSGELGNPIKNSLLASVWTALAPIFEANYKAVPDDLLDNVDEAPSDPLPQTLRRIPPEFVCELGTDIVWQTTSQIMQSEDDAQEERASVEFEWATEVAAGVGVALHEFLQFNSHRIFDVKIDGALKRQWRAELTNLRVPEARIEFAVNRLSQAIKDIQSDEQAGFIFADHPYVQNEYAISTVENGSVKQFRLDRTFVDEAGTRWIVDYKSTITHNQDVQDFVDTQVAERHQTQLEKYGALMAQIDNRPIKLAVYFPLLKQLRTWDYQPTNQLSKD